MNLQQVQLTSFTPPAKSSGDMGVKNTLIVYLFHWPLFIIALVITFSFAVVYLKKAKPVYEVKASLIIKDGSKTPDQQSALHEIDLSGSTKIIENEMEILKSKQLLTQMVYDLGLWVGYSKKEGLSSVDLYKASPVSFTLVKKTGELDHKSIDIVIKDKESFFIKMPDGQLKQFFFKDRFKNSFGTWKLSPTSDIGQYKGDEMSISLSDPEHMALDFQKSIDISVSNKMSTALVLTVEDQNEQRGKDILNRVLFNYNWITTSQKQREAKKTLDFINQRLASLTGELTDAEKGIEDFKSSRGLTDISSESKISLENMQTNDSRLNEVNVQLSVIDGIERYVNSPRNMGRAPATLGITDPALSNLIEKFSDLQLQREKLLATTPETNPDFEVINRQIHTTRAAIKESVYNIKSSLLNTRNRLQSFNSRFESSIKNIPTQERQLISIKRQQSIKENLYTYLLQKQEEVSVSHASTLASDQVVDEAYAGPAKEPKKALAFAVALVIGLGLPSGLIYGRNVLKGKITSLYDITNVTALPVIAELPLEKSQKTLAVDNERTNPISEQFRALRSKLYYLNSNKQQGTVTLITSSVPGEGKSFVSSNLAIAMAFTDKKTILLELDMRKPKIAEFFKLNKEKPGISDYLNGSATLQDIIQTSVQYPGLHIISSGREVSTPSELLEKVQLENLFEVLKSTYDDVIIDSPPVRLVPDAMILSKVTDVTLYIIRQGVTEKSELDLIKDATNQRLFNNLQLVFNGLHRMKHGYGYSYNDSYYGGENKTSVFSNIFSDFLSRF